MVNGYMPDHWDHSDSWTTETDSNGRMIVFCSPPFVLTILLLKKIDFDENILKLIYACVVPCAHRAKQAQNRIAAIEITV